MSVQRRTLLPIFQELYPLLHRYEPPLVARADFESKYELWSEKDFVLDGKQRKDIFFAGLIVQSDYVGFYFMPVYTEQERADLFPSELLKTLKGKGCFHIKKMNPELKQQIDLVLETGFELYRSRGWI